MYQRTIFISIYLPEDQIYKGNRRIVMARILGN